MEKLRGPFKDILPNFFNYKKTIGYKYNNISDYKELDLFLFKKGIVNLNNTKKIFKLAVLEEKNYNRKKTRYNCLVNINEYLVNVGKKQLYLEKYYFEKNSDFVPIILSVDEAFYLIDIIDKLCKNLNNHLEYTIPVITRLLYSSGLRIQEALNLKNTDFSKEKGTIIIKNSKNNKTRVIPLSDTMLDTINKYLDKISKFNYNSDYLFLNTSYQQYSSIFKKAKFILGISKLRIHDLRHTFCNITLNNCYKNKVDETYARYMLSIYMGHSSYDSTNYYVRNTKYNTKEIYTSSNKINKMIFKKDGDKNE